MDERHWTHRYAAGRIWPNATAFFWFAITLVYAGLALLIVDVQLEPSITARFRRIAQIVVVSGILLFSWKVVFVSAPLNFFALSTRVEYEPGTTIAGISWRPYFSEMDVSITNPTERNYEDLELVITPDHPVAAIGQLSNLTDVSFEDNYGVSERATIRDLSKQYAVALVLLATDAGYKIHCGRIPPRSNLKLAMALVAIKEDTPGIDVSSAKIPEDPVLEQTLSPPGVHYWFGHPAAKNIFSARPKSTKISIYGHYVAANRKHYVNTDVQIH